MEGEERRGDEASTDPPPAAPRRDRKIAPMVPVLALIVSIFSILLVILNNRQSNSSETINAQYQTFVDLTTLPIREPGVSHLISLSDTYDVVKCDVHQYLGSVSGASAAAARLKERFVANYIFTLFERALYQKQRTASWTDRIVSSEADEFNDAVIAYFTGRVLRNPRLLWYWSPNGGKLYRYYEPSTIAYYNSHVLHEPGLPLTERPDPVGPSC